MKIQIFKNSWFERFARKQEISDVTLVNVVHRIERGLIDANLGGGVIKQRIAKIGQGKSGGYRTIVLYKQEKRAFFVFGFEKSERSNIANDEEVQFKKMAKDLFLLSDEQLVELIKKGQLFGVKDDKKI